MKFFIILSHLFTLEEVELSSVVKNTVHASIKKLSILLFLLILNTMAEL